jgi:hypothetical protein
MVRVLFSATPAHGHIFPLLPLARAFRKRGDTVALMSAPSVFPVFAADDVEFLAAGAELPDILAEVQLRIGVNLLEGIVPAAAGEGFGGTRVDMSLEESLAVAREWRPDLAAAAGDDDRTRPGQVRLRRRASRRAQGDQGAGRRVDGLLGCGRDPGAPYRDRRGDQAGETKHGAARQAAVSGSCWIGTNPTLLGVITQKREGG